jgi:hypothetical protein
MRPAVVRVHLPDGSQVDRLTSPWEDNALVVAALCELVAVRDPEHFALYEQRGVDQLYVYASENVLDVQVQWTKAARREAAAKKSKGFFSSLFSKKEAKSDDHDDWAANPGVRRFVLKRRIYTKGTGHEPAGALDKREQALLFHTVQTEVALGLHAVDEEPALRLAAIARTISDSGVLKPLGPLPRIEPAQAEPTDQWALCRLDDVPAGAMAKKIDAKKWTAKVDKLQPTLQGQSLDMWISEARALPTFGCAFYAVVRNEDPSVPVKLPAELAVAINYFGMRFIDTKTRAVIDHFPLLNILGWSASPIRFVVRVKLNKPVGAGISMVTFRFSTYNPKMVTTQSARRTARAQLERARVLTAVMRTWLDADSCGCLGSTVAPLRCSLTAAAAAAAAAQGKEMCDLLFSYATEMLKAVGIKQN